jgi:hypothetical protein
MIGATTMTDIIGLSVASVITFLNIHWAKSMNRRQTNDFFRRT